MDNTGGAQARQQPRASRAAVLAYLGANGPSSRADLARALGLSSPLITRLVRGLIGEGRLKELDTTVPRSGRPARLLGLAERAGAAIGVTLSRREHLTLIEVGLDGAVARSHKVRFDALAPRSRDQLIDEITGFARQATRPLLGVGVGVAGNVDSQSLGNTHALLLGMVHEPLGDLLRSSLDLPVLVENDVKALAVAERLYGAGRGFENFALIAVGEGIGGAIVAHGQIQRGHLGFGGSVGHVSIDENGRECICGGRGCLENYASMQGMKTTAVEQGLISPDDGFETLVQMADAGDEAVLRIFDDAASLLGRAAATLVQIAGPEAVIIRGEATLQWRYWQRAFDEALRAGVSAQVRGVRVIVEDWQDELWARGAAALVLSAPFSHFGESGAQGADIRKRLMRSHGMHDDPGETEVIP